MGNVIKSLILLCGLTLALPTVSALAEGELQSQANIESVVKDGTRYLCKSVGRSWQAGTRIKGEFISYKELQRDSFDRYKRSKRSSLLKLSQKYKALAASGAVACNHTCGNGVLDTSTGEQCDDGNGVNFDLCDASCELPSVTQVAVGPHSTCALLSSGGVKCWGDGESGQLGYGNKLSIGDNESPSKVGAVNVGRAVTQIAVGSFHTCALLDNGAVKCWGYGSSGQLGYGNTKTIGDNETPISVGTVKIGGKATQIAAGGATTCALLRTGNVVCWGNAGFGQLGHGTTNNVGDDETPASVGPVNIGAPVSQISVSENYVCALLTSGAVKCWGLGDQGVLGYGNTNTIGDDETPASVGTVDIGGVAQKIATGSGNTCALLTTGSITCWGYGGFGAVGLGNTNNIGDDELPSSVGSVPVGAVVSDISIGDGVVCAIISGGSVKCWGLGDRGTLGYGNITTIGDDETPAALGSINIGGAADEISVGGSVACALRTNGAVNCWGFGFHGGLGYGNKKNIGDDETPASVGPVRVL